MFTLQAGAQRGDHAAMRIVVLVMLVATGGCAYMAEQQRRADACAADPECAEAQRQHRIAAGRALQGYAAQSQQQPAYVPPPVYVVPAAPPGCSSDYSCPYGQRCVKPNYSSQGMCTKVVNEYGTPVYGTPPSGNSVGVKTPSPSDCHFDTECAIGFKCDTPSGACLKR